MTYIKELTIWIFFSLTCSGNDWIFPVQNTYPAIPTKSQVLLVQSVNLAIWEHASRKFVMRFVDPGMQFLGTKQICIYTIIPSEKDKGYSREVITLKRDGEFKWKLAEKKVQSVDSKQVEKCHAAFKQLLLSVRFIAEYMGPGPDEAIIGWECSRELDGLSWRMQATQFGYPRLEKDVKLFEEIFNVVHGNND